TKNDQVIRTARSGIAILVIRLRDVHLASNDGLHAGFLRGFIEAHRAEQISMVGDGHGRHLEFRCLFYKRVVTTGAVKKAEAGVEMEMHEVRHKTLGPPKPHVGSQHRPVDKDLRPSAYAYLLTPTP